MQGAPEFFGALPLMAVGLFALNNGVLKQAWPGWVTGKLSDILVCFFLPLFISAILERLSRLAPVARVAIGIAITAAVFTALKTSAAASTVHDAGIATLVQRFGMFPAPNRVDTTDLCALPILALAWMHARRKVGHGFASAQRRQP
jgi:hypothetical protein